VAEALVNGEQAVLAGCNLCTLALEGIKELIRLSEGRS
jgi:hypothetical protein